MIHCCFQKNHSKQIGVDLKMMRHGKVCSRKDCNGFIPFSNLKRNKIRTVLVLAKAEFDNLILCQITSKPYTRKSAIKIESTDFIKETYP